MSSQWTMQAGAAPPPHKPIQPGEHRELSLTTLVELLEQQREYFDTRLAEHHDSLLKRLAEEAAAMNGRFPVPLVPQRASGVPAPTVVGKSNEDRSSFTSADGRTSVQSKEQVQIQAARRAVPPRYVSFNACEKLQQDKLKAVAGGPRHKSVMASRISEMTGEADTWFEPGHKRKQCRKVLETKAFEVFICTLILSNVLFLGYEVQTMIGVPEDHTPFGLRVIEYCYTVAFATELAVRFFACPGGSFFRGKDAPWHMLDTFLVCVSLVELILDVLRDVSAKLEYVRVVRTARIIRILRVIRIMKFFRPLRILVISVLNTLRSLFWTVVLLVGIIYLFGLIFTVGSTYGDRLEENELLRQNFGSLWLSLLTLFKCITGGMDWEVSIEALGVISMGWPTLFVFYIAFCQLALLNVVTGVVCQTAIESARQDQDIVMQTQLAAKERYVEQFGKLFAKFDSDRSGSITLVEFEELLQTGPWKDYFASMDLTIDDAWSLFKLLDNSEGDAINVDEFVTGCLKLRGTARSIDMHMLMYQSKWTMKQLSQVMVSMEEMRSAVYGVRLAPYSASCSV